MNFQQLRRALPHLDELRLCAMEGDTEAEYLLGQRLLGQRGRALEGMEHLKNAAKKRHLQACERLGSAYLYGEGDVPQDKKQAMVYYEQALALGSTSLQISSMVRPPMVP